MSRLPIIRFVASLVLLVVWTLPLYAQSAAQEMAQAEAAYHRDDYKAAETHFGRALQSSKGNANIEVGAFHGRGVARLELHNWSGAKEDLTHAIELDPTDAGAFAAWGMARKALGDYDRLLLDAREAARLSPNEFASFEDDAKSTVLWRRMLLVFFGMAMLLLAVGGWALGRVLVRIMRAEREANRVTH